MACRLIQSLVNDEFKNGQGRVQILVTNPEREFHAITKNTWFLGTISALVQIINMLKHSFRNFL